jgi:hypothetical protein
VVAWDRRSALSRPNLADEDKRAQSIAMVVWVGTVGAVIGSPAALWANRVGTSLGVREWVSPTLLGALALMVAGLIVTTAMRPDPLVVAGGIDPDAPRQNPIKGADEALRAI